MPKISAPTVAAHREAQQASLLAAARSIIGETGVAGVTPRSVSERAGLARSSFYEYFPSRDDLLAAIALEAFDQWAFELAAAVEGAPAGRERLHAYVHATMRMAGDGKHSLATDLQAVDLSPRSYDAIMAMHDTLSKPLRTLLEQLGVADAATQAVLVQGLLTAGMQLITHGAPVAAVTASINGVLDAGVQA